MRRPEINNRLPRRYSFDQTGDVVRLVTVLLDGDDLTVTTRFVTDTVQQTEVAHFANVADLTSTEDVDGLLLTWRSPLFEWSDWPRIRHRRRF